MASENLFVLGAPSGVRGELIRSTRTTLLRDFPMSGKSALPIAVISSDMWRDQSTVAANLAVSFSQLSGRTLLVDANLQTPRMHDIFGLGIVNGLGNILAEGRAAALTNEPLGIRRLSVLTAGTIAGDHDDLLLGSRFRELVDCWIESFDFVIVDTPATSRGTVARGLAKALGSAVLVHRNLSGSTVETNGLLTKLKASNVRVATCAFDG